MQALVRRTKMVGGGLSYDVYVPISEIPHFEAMKYHTTTIIYNGINYVEYYDATMPVEHWTKDKGWDRYEEYCAHEKSSRVEMLAIARRVFPELNKLDGITDHLPTLWTMGLLPKHKESHAEYMVEV